jgi:cytochrome c-type biogenesis protein CcmH
MIVKVCRHATFTVLLGLCLLLLNAWPLFAVESKEMLADPALEARARNLSKELRCMVCQNQSIDDSEAPLARDLRLLVRERIADGDSDQQVLNFLVARYGEFVLLKPRFELQTLLLWLLPPLVLGGGGIALWFQGRRRSRSGSGGDNSTPKLTADEQARLEQLIAEEPLPDWPAQDAETARFARVKPL